MKLFNKKNVYTIVVDKETNFEVQRFANEHCMKRSTINIMSATDYIVIDFGSKEERNSITNKIKERFEQLFNVEIGENIIWITKKEA